MNQTTDAVSKQNIDFAGFDNPRHLASPNVGCIIVCPRRVQGVVGLTSIVLLNSSGGGITGLTLHVCFRTDAISHQCYSYIQMRQTTIRDVTVNRLLAKLPRNEYDRLRPGLKRISLSLGEVLYEPGDTITYVYFPNDSIVSLLSALSERSTLEVGMVGNEGMAGLPIFMGVNVSQTRALVQGSGSAMRMTSAAMRREANRLGTLHSLMRRYSHSLLTQVTLSSACNRFHAIDARLARWLLMTSDRLGLEEFRLTQDFMSNMLGVRREGVNKAAGALQTDKLIRYRRGMITILDRWGLEANSCKCYAIIKAESDEYLS